MKLTEFLTLLVLIFALVMGVLKTVGTETNHLLGVTIEQQTGAKITTQ